MFWYVRCRALQGVCVRCIRDCLYERLYVYLYVRCSVLQGVAMQGVCVRAV